MSEPAHYRYVSADRRVREDRRFVAGKGRFVADIDLPNTQHVALVTCPYAAARIKSIDKSAALAMPGVHYVLDGARTGASHAAADERARNAQRAAPAAGVRDRALFRRMGRRRRRRHAARSPRTRPRAVEVDYEPLPFVLDAEQAMAGGSPLVHEAHGSNVLLDRTFVWGEVEKDFAASPRKLSLRVKWGAPRDRADRNIRRGRELGSLARNARRLGLDPDAAIPRADRARR